MATPPPPPTEDAVRFQTVTYVLFALMAIGALVVAIIALATRKTGPEGPVGPAGPPADKLLEPAYVTGTLGERDTVLSAEFVTADLDNVVPCGSGLLTHNALLDEIVVEADGCLQISAQAIYIVGDPAASIIIGLKGQVNGVDVFKTDMCPPGILGGLGMVAGEWVGPVCKGDTVRFIVHRQVDPYDYRPDDSNQFTMCLTPSHKK